MSEHSLQEVADSLKAPVRMVWEASALPRAALELIQQEERIQVSQLGPADTPPDPSTSTLTLPLALHHSQHLPGPGHALLCHLCLPTTECTQCTQCTLCSHTTSQQESLADFRRFDDGDIILYYKTWTHSYNDILVAYHRSLG